MNGLSPAIVTVASPLTVLEVGAATPLVASYLVGTAPAVGAFVLFATVDSGNGRAIVVFRTTVL